MSTAASDLTAEEKTELEAQIKAKGDEIRALKDGGADKAAVAPLVEELLALKAKLDPDSVKPKKKKEATTTTITKRRRAAVERISRRITHQMTTPNPTTSLPDPRTTPSGTPPSSATPVWPSPAPSADAW